MVCTIGLTCPYLLEINNKERYQVAFSDGKRHSLRNLSRWLCECCGSLPSEESELGNCVIVSPLREGHLGRAASIAAGKRLLSASHPRKSSLSVLALSTALGRGEWRRGCEPCLGLVTHGGKNGFCSLQRQGFLRSKLKWTKPLLSPHSQTCGWHFSWDLPQCWLPLAAAALGLWSHPAKWWRIVPAPGSTRTFCRASFWV